MIKMLEDDCKERGGFYKANYSGNKLLNFNYMSKRMKHLVEYFCDVLIIDTSHKTNRFNCPLLDIALVNNLGKTSTCFIGLLENQKYQTFI